MNPLLQEFLGALFRQLLQGVFASLVTYGVLTEDQSAKMLIGAVGMLLTLVWVLWVKWISRLKFVTALISPVGTTERAVERMVSAGDTPSVATPKTIPPTHFSR